VSLVPDPTPDLVTAAWRELVAQSADLIAAGLVPEGEQIGDIAWPVAWVFKWKAAATVSGKEGASIVLSQPSGWSSPNRHNTLEFPRLIVEVYADQSRDAGQGPEFKDAPSRAMDVWRVVDRVLHRVDAGAFTWGGTDGGIRIVSSTRSQEPQIMEVPDTDGVYRLLTSYDIELG
jgi:hypothetical protein